MRDVHALGRELSVSARKVDRAALAPLLASIERDRARLPDLARHDRGEPWREKLSLVRARLEATRARGDAGYPDVAAYLEDLALLARTLSAAGLSILAQGRIRDVVRRAEAFGFHLATMDLRQHSAIHEAAVAEILAAGGAPGYGALDESAKVTLLTGLLDRADIGAPRDRALFSPETRDLLAALDVVGRARRDQGAEACERYIVSFTSAPSDLLEVLFLVRAARLAPDELRPVPLLEQLADLEAAEQTARKVLAIRPLRAAIGGELEVMIGYSDSGKEVGYVASQVALHRAQEALAKVTDSESITLTVFHGRGGAVGRGGGPANRAIRAQPSAALRGRLRVTEQGETIAARYGRPEIARRDLEQMVNAVLVGSLGKVKMAPAKWRRTIDRAALAAREAYAEVVADDAKIVRYALLATPMREIAELPIASRPASRKPRITFADLRAIPWVFSWNQSRHGIPGWFGLGAALEAIVRSEGVARARALYEEWPFFHALVDNARLALARADVHVAEHYARLSDPETRGVFDLIRAEHARTVARVLEVTKAKELLGAWPALSATVERRNPDVDVLSHAQIELLHRLRDTARDPERASLREALFVTINGIAAGLMTAG
jgi:phosphoenolpyruvate carboxylase